MSEVKIVGKVDWKCKGDTDIGIDHKISTGAISANVFEREYPNEDIRDRRYIEAYLFALESFTRDTPYAEEAYDAIVRLSEILVRRGLLPVAYDRAHTIHLSKALTEVEILKQLEQRVEKLEKLLTVSPTHRDSCEMKELNPDYKAAMERLGKFGALFLDYKGCPRGTAGRMCAPLEDEVLSMDVLTDVDGGRWIPVNEDALHELVERYKEMKAKSEGA